MKKKVKYDNIIFGKPRTYFYRTFIVGIQDEKGCLKLRIAWDEEKFIIRSAQLCDGNKYNDIPEIISTAKVPYGKVSETL